MASANTLTAVEASTQMGVAMLLSGDPYWFRSLQEMVDASEIDEVQRADLERLYDGYKMTWEFTGPTVAAVENNIDSVCILGASHKIVEQTDAAVTYDYSNGGFCVGITYTGEFAAVPQVWAVWIDETDFNSLITSGPSEVNSDEANWTEVSNFDVSWTTSRYLPKEERSVDYYENEYRFTKD